jgi:hypothetical protein
MDGPLLQTVWAIVQVLAAIVMWVSIALFVLKSLWNLVVPYAMIHEALNQPQNKHGWSLFILFDLGLLAMALIGSAFADGFAPTNTWTMALCGFGLFVVCYAHLIAIMLIGGYLFGLFPKNNQGAKSPPQ